MDDPELLAPPLRPPLGNTSMLSCVDVQVIYFPVHLCHWLMADVPIEGFIWGHPVKSLLEARGSTSSPRAYGLIIMSDLIFNHSQVRAS